MPERKAWLTVLVAYVTAFAVLFIPLIVDPRGYDSFRQPKEIAFRGLALLLLALAGPALIVAHRRGTLHMKLHSRWFCHF